MSGAGRLEMISAEQVIPFPTEWYPLSAVDHFWFEWRLAAALGLAAEAGLDLRAPLRALDVGGGTGVLRDQLEHVTAWTIDLADLNRGALLAARPGRGRHLYYDIGEVRPELAGSYDVVLLFDVLEHVEDTAPFLRALVAHLKPGGTLLVNVPALPVLYGAYDVAAGHVRRYVPRTLRAELEGSGLQVRETRYWGLSMVPVLLLRRVTQRSGTPAGELIRSGFQPPSPFVHAMLRRLARAETRLLPRPPLGTSVLMAARAVPREK